jgi:phage host-nuclease inhibitor protein Gam
MSVLGEKMGRLAHKRFEMERLESEVNARVEAVRSVYVPRLASLRNVVEHMEVELEHFCRRERGVLMNGDAKSVRTPHGRVGFRLTGGQVLLEEGRDPEEACRALRERELSRLVRVHESPDRTSIRKALVDGEVNAEQLAACGIRVTDGEEAFYCVVERAEGGGES